MLYRFLITSTTSVAGPYRQLSNGPSAGVSTRNVCITLPGNTAYRLLSMSASCRNYHISPSHCQPQSVLTRYQLSDHHAGRQLGCCCERHSVTALAFVGSSAKPATAPLRLISCRGKWTSTRRHICELCLSVESWRWSAPKTCSSRTSAMALSTAARPGHHASIHPQIDASTARMLAPSLTHRPVPAPLRIVASVAPTLLCMMNSCPRSA